MPTIDHIGGGLAEADFKLCAWRTNDSKLKRIGDPLPLDEHLAHHRVHVVVHRAFDGIGLQDERLAPTLDYRHRRRRYSRRRFASGTWRISLAKIPSASPRSRRLSASRFRGWVRRYRWRVRCKFSPASR